MTSKNFDCATSTGGVVSPNRRKFFCILDYVFDLRSQLGEGSPFKNHSGPTVVATFHRFRTYNILFCSGLLLVVGWAPLNNPSLARLVVANLSQIWTILQRDLYLQIWIRVGSCHLYFSGLAGSGNLPLILVLQYFILWRTFIDGGVGSPQSFFTGPIDCSDPSFLWIYLYHWFRDSYLHTWLRVGSWNLQFSGPTGGGNLPPFALLQIQQKSGHIDSPHALAPIDRDLHFQQPASHCDKTESCIFWQNPLRFWLWRLDQSSWTIGQELNRSYWTSFTLDFILSWLPVVIQPIFLWQIVLAAVNSSCLFVIFVQIFWHLKQRHIFLPETESIHSLSAPFVPTSDTGTPGPKSRYKPNRFGSFSTGIFHCLCVFLLIYPFSQGFVRGEGCILNMEDAEASTIWQKAFIANCGAKPHVTRPEASRYAPSWHAAQSKVVKRSFKRAYKRAVALGTTWYRGRCYAPADFPKGMQYSVDSDFSKQTSWINPTLIKCHQNNQDHRRISVLTWNSGGLSTAKLDEVKAWMMIQNISVAIFAGNALDL